MTTPDFSKPMTYAAFINIMRVAITLARAKEAEHGNKLLAQHDLMEAFRGVLHFTVHECGQVAAMRKELSEAIALATPPQLHKIAEIINAEDSE